MPKPEHLIFSSMFVLHQVLAKWEPKDMLQKVMC
jgi:hypothetical protein